MGVPPAAGLKCLVMERRFDQVAITQRNAVEWLTYLVNSCNGSQDELERLEATIAETEEFLNTFINFSDARATPEEVRHQLIPRDEEIH
jgi:hypothetical protein